MEVTKKVGDPHPSGPQGDPSASSQQLGGGLRGSQGPWINSESPYFRQGLSPSTKAIMDGASGPASQAHAAEPAHQLLWDPAELRPQCGYERTSRDALRRSSSSPFPSPCAGAQVNLVLENGTLTLPLYTRSDMVQHKFRPFWLQVQRVREGKAPAKVLRGWGKGPRSTDQLAALGIRKRQWAPCFYSREDGSAAAQGLLLVPAQDWGQAKCLCPVRAPPTPTWANPQAPDTTPTPPAGEPYTASPDHLTDDTAVTKDLSPKPPLSVGGNKLQVLLEPPNVVTSCQDKVNFGCQEKLATTGATPKESPDRGQDLEVARKQALPKQLERPAEEPRACNSGPGSPTPVPGMPGTSQSHRSSQEIGSSQPDQQPLSVCNNACFSVPLSACHVTGHRQTPVQSPREATQIAPSSAPTCQLRDAVEDHVLVVDMATGNTKMGLLCHDPMGSRAVLVGLAPNHPATGAPENVPSPRPLAVPIVSPDGNRCSFWPVSSVLSSPVPSSLSSGSYREVALLSKEARHNLESWDLSGTETPNRAGMLTGSVPLGMPLQRDERTLNRAHDPAWSKPNAENNESTHTISVLDASGMQDTAMDQAKKKQWMNSEPTPEPTASARPQEASRFPLPADIGGHSWKEVNTARPGNSRDEGARQAPAGGWLPLAKQYPPSGQPPPTGEPHSAEQHPSPRQTHLFGQPPLTKQHTLRGQPCLTGTPQARQLSPTAQPPFPQETPISREVIFSRGAPTTTREAAQASALCQEGEALGLPTHVALFQVPLASEKTCVYVSREKVFIGATPSSNTYQLSSWQPGSRHRAQEEPLSLMTFTCPGTDYKILPVAMVGTEPQGPQQEPRAEDATDVSAVTNPGLPCGAYYELVSPPDALPGQPSLLRGHSLGPYQDTAAVVIDTGAGFTKCGLAGDDHILSVVPSCVQLLQQPAQQQPRYARPEDAEDSYATVLNRGVVSDWDALEVLWQHLFYCRLGLQPEELAVLVADSPISPRTNREKVAEILFERFHVPAMQTVHQALLALYAYGRTTGLVLGSGHGTSYVAPIVTGDLAPLNTYRLDVAGADLTEYLAQQLLAGGCPRPKTELVNQIKEACCYVALDVKAEMARNPAEARAEFVLPDKQVITLGSERFCCPEALFQPSLLGLNQPGLPQLALLSIGRLEARQQEQLLANVVLDGGNTLMSGFPERLRQELGPRATVLGSPHRAVAAWLGGSIMASRDSFRSLWLSRREYEEEGPWAIYKYHL